MRSPIHSPTFRGQRDEKESKWETAVRKAQKES